MFAKTVFRSKHAQGLSAGTATNWRIDKFDSTSPPNSSIDLDTRATSLHGVVPQRCPHLEDLLQQRTKVPRCSEYGWPGLSFLAVHAQHRLWRCINLTGIPYFGKKAIFRRTWNISIFSTAIWHLRAHWPWTLWTSSTTERPGVYTDTSALPSKTWHVCITINDNIKVSSSGTWWMYIKAKFNWNLCGLSYMLMPSIEGHTDNRYVQSAYDANHWLWFRTIWGQLRPIPDATFHLDTLTTGSLPSLLRQ